MSNLAITGSSFVWFALPGRWFRCRRKRLPRWQWAAESPIAPCFHCAIQLMTECRCTEWTARRFESLRV